jgi:hypothetical protein
MKIISEKRKSLHLPSNRKDTGTAKDRDTTLLYLLFAKKTSFGAGIHLCNVTVATGEIYAARVAFNPQLTEGIHRARATASHQTAALWKQGETATVSAQTLFLRVLSVF